MRKEKGVDIKIILEQKVERNGDIKNFLNGSGVAVRYYPYNKRGINHIKLIIIDGLIAVVGGANLGLHSPVNHDIAVTIKGPAVKILETVFHDDWDYSKIGGKK